MNLTLQERTLAYGAVHEKKDNLVDYTFENGNKLLKHTKVSELDILSSFSKNNNLFQAYCRSQLFEIMRDGDLDRKMKIDRLSRYLDAYFDLICKIDDNIYEHNDDKVYSGVPIYVPDRLSDMGSDHIIKNSARRGREKLHVNKKKILNDAKDLFVDIFSTDGIQKKQIVSKISNHIIQTMPKDFEKRAHHLGGSIPLDHFGPDVLQRRLSVCRHHALTFQVLNQTLGITTRLLKCTVTHFDNTGKKTGGGAHACNLVRLDGQRYLIDVTNPHSIEGRRKVGKGIIEAKIDLNNNMYTRTIEHDNGKRIYTSRNNMHYRIKETQM